MTPLRILAAVLVAAVSAAGWWLLAPTQLGGRTSYALIDGVSMNPGLERGDLAVVRKRASYEVGDAVLYDNAQIGRKVLHRIVRVDGDRFVLKGDNNDYLDAYRPEPGEIRGTLWFNVAGLGALVEWLRQPVNAAIVLFVGAFVALGAGRAASRRRRPVGPGAVVVEPAARRPGRLDPAGARTLLTGALAALALFALLGLAAFTRPTARVLPLPGAWAHTGLFAYGAEVPPSPVYPTGRVETGQPAFARLVPRVLVSFAYAFEARRPASLHGTARLEAVVSDGNGWTRTLALSRPRDFDGATVTVRAPLGLERLARLVQQVRDLTGMPVSSLTVAVVPRLAVAGSVGGRALAEEFEPELPLVYDGTALRLAATEEGRSPLTPRTEGTGVRVVPATLPLGPLQPSVRSARLAAVLGVVVCLVLALLAWRRLGHGAEPGESQRIAARYGRRLVEAASSVPHGRWVTELHDMESLVRVAGLYERMILHTVEDGRDVYFVDDGVAVYRYRPAAPSPRAALAATGR
jgi:signal peptidase I